eukprot:TRINITY_DN4774_c0_g1_i6.p1 TRINITY_DN4774_c0_g1~~TRINITY_DN4774_c0_g1_i6.p1  ORF type:complete len:171 (-),score=37.87 TRINITY_DN4774_c0_g1_i6:548-1060(-)
MARNNEKNYGVLNRLYLQNNYKEHKERPTLNTLHTAKAIRRWIPVIKSDIQYCLHHLSGVRNYPEYKIKEYQKRLEMLQDEYQCFVEKHRELDPIRSELTTPGDIHSYIPKKQLKKKRKRNNQNNNQDSKKRKMEVPDTIPMPLLDLYPPDPVEDQDEAVTSVEENSCII